METAMDVVREEWYNSFYKTVGFCTVLILAWCETLSCHMESMGDGSYTTLHCQYNCTKLFRRDSISNHLNFIQSVDVVPRSYVT